MRVLVPVLLAGFLHAQEPLALHGEAHAQAVAALVALGAGDGRALESLPVDLHRSPIGLVDPERPEVARRWTAALRDAVARLGPPARGDAEAVLARWLERSGGDPSAALDLLPLPAARTAVARAAERAFDRGDAAAWLALRAALGGPADPRDALAARLVAGDALPAPGLPVPVPAGAPPREAFVRRGAQIIAADPFGRPAWQVRVAEGVEAAWDERILALRERTALRIVAADGSWSEPLVMPAEARLLGVSAGAVAVAMHGSVWRVAPGAQPERMELLDDPEGPPLLGAAGTAWWLGRHHLVRSQDGRLTHRVRHLLPVDEGWRLARAGDGPCIVAPDGRAWSVPALEPMLAALAQPERLAVLDRLGLHDRAAALLESAPTQPWPAEAALRTLIARRASLPPGLSAALLPADAALRELWMWVNDGRPPANLAVPGDAADAALQPADWAWTRFPSSFAAQPQAPRIAMHRADGRIVVEAMDRDGPRWIRRFDPLPFLVAPGEVLAGQGDRVVVVEGDVRLRVLRAVDGAELAVHRPSGGVPAPVTLTALASGEVVALVPLGIANTARWFAEGRDIPVALPAPAVAARGVDDGVELDLADGRRITLRRVGATVAVLPR